MLVAAAVLVAAASGSGSDQAATPRAPSDQAATSRAASDRAAAPGAASDEVVTRGRPTDRCRMAVPRARAAAGLTASEEGRVLRQSQARAWAALRQSYGERWATVSPRARQRQRDEIREGPFFSAVTTLDLELGVAVRRDVSPDARLELRLLTPRGHVYQALRVALPAAADPRGTRTSGQVATRRAERVARPLIAALPVAGTAIVNHSLYGPWTVEPYLDGQTCGPPLRFWIGE